MVEIKMTAMVETEEKMMMVTTKDTVREERACRRIKMLRNEHMCVGSGWWGVRDEGVREICISSEGGTKHHCNTGGVEARIDKLETKVEENTRSKTVAERVFGSRWLL